MPCAEATGACAISVSPTQPAFRRKGLAPILLPGGGLVGMPCNCGIRLSNSASVQTEGTGAYSSTGRRPRGHAL
jgi:hypothetical protein